MANHSSAKKAIRQITKRTQVNRNRLSRVKTFVKKAEVSLGMHKGHSADSANAMDFVKQAESELMRAAAKGVFRKKTASRKVSRLVKRAKALQA